MQTKLLRKLLLTGIAAVGACWSTARAGSYPSPEYSGPETGSTFSYPAAFKPFAPPVHHDPVAASAPGIAEWTRINAPGDTMALTGVRLSAFEGDAEGRDTRFVFYSPFNQEVILADGLIRQLDRMEAAISLPTSLPNKEMYLLWPRNRDGFGLPVAVNKTEAWWVGPNEVTRSEPFSVYGRNLVLAGTTAYAYVQERGEWLESTSSNPYKADFTLPSSWPDGSYTLWMHNGHGMEYGWSRPVTLTVRSPFAFNGKTINVKNDFGARGDGVSDDYAAINAAFSAAQSGDTIYFPAGTYLVSSTLFSLNNGKRVVGAGRDATVIASHSSLQANAPDGMYGSIISENGGQNIEFSNLTLSSGRYPTSSGRTYSFRGARNMKFSNVRLTQLDDPNHSAEQPLLFIENAHMVTLVDCEVIVSGDITLGAATQVKFDRCQFYGINDNNDMIVMNGGEDVSVINCSAEPYDISDPTDGHGWAKGRFVAGHGSRGTFVRNFYYGNNVTTDMCNRDDPGVDDNSGEQLMFEGLLTLYRGSPISATSRTVRFADLNRNLTDNIISIIDGPGVGQNRAVIAYDSATKTVTLDEPWLVTPDASSRVVIGSYMSRFAVYDNDFDGLERGVANGSDVGSAGVEAYGGCFDLVVDNNRFHQLRSAIECWSLSEDTVIAGTLTLQPNYFNLYMNNTINHCRYGIENRVAHWENLPYHQDIGLLGNVFRNNTITDMLSSAFSTATWRDYPSIGLTIFDGNVVTDVGIGVNHDLDYWHVTKSPLLNQIWIGNEFNQVNSGVGIVIPDGSTKFFHKNKWNQARYSGYLPGGNLELPLRMPTLSKGVQIAVPVLNNGTDRLTWTAATSSPWINIDQGSGTVTDELSEGVLLVSLNENALPANGAEAVVTVTGNSGQVKQLSITYKETDTVTDPPPPVNPPVPVLTGLTVSGPSLVDEQTAAQFYCDAQFSDGTTQRVDPLWSVGSSSASVNAAGLFSSGNVEADAAETITAVYEGMTNQFTFTVRYVPPTLVGLSIIGASEVTEGDQVGYRCTALYSDGTSSAVTPVWSVSSLAVSISASGLLSVGDLDENLTVLLRASKDGVSTQKSIAVINLPPPLTVTGLTVTGPVEMTERTEAQFSCQVTYSDGSVETVVPVWSVDSSAVTISATGLLTAYNVDAAVQVTVTASYEGAEDRFSLEVSEVGNQVVYPLTGFAGKWVRAELWDDVAGQWHDLGDAESPTEFVVEHVVPNQWYWLTLKEFNQDSRQWIEVHASWLRM